MTGEIGLPDIDGFELCRVIKKVPHYQDTPLVFFTTSSNPEYETNAKEAGGFEIWEKKSLREVDALRRKVRASLASPTGKRI